ncbi:putative acyltransferase [Tenacibaculum adriaticum]|uniref:Putative acyltransferase n=1 Tax=Tenacibaculum adriaticum TaxID=413713 RepID=A0A5S5DZI5_9FLAO|nr:DUF5009 domain-containing protein [Tenacibaculum adriaticum]TYQ00153.1 putative acyltransferase [Tenacibaculum adriaticum]
MNKVKSEKRLLALDVFRGITISAMILVNNPGDWSYKYTPLSHAEWNGLSPTDLVFPFFVLIMGVSMYLSFRKFDFKFSAKTFKKIAKRSLLIFIIGLLLNWFSLFLSKFNSLTNEESSFGFFQKISQAALSYDNLRILGVLQRLALISFFGSIIILLIKHKYIPWLIGSILILYWVIIGATESYLPTENSIVAIIDRAVLGANHMYTDHFSNGTQLVLDPEGLFSTIPAISQVLVGFLIGKIISEKTEMNNTLQKIFIVGTIILFIGFLINYGFPINKKIWSSSFVLVTSGLGALSLALLIWIIDVKEKKKWSAFFESFGVNPLFIYVISFLLSILIGNIGLTHNGNWNSIKSFLYSNYINSIFSNNYLASLVFALLFVLINWGVGHILYKKKIYIKL